MSDPGKVTNAEFVRALFGADPGNVAITSFKASPNSDAARWGGKIVPIASSFRLAVIHNNYFCSAVVRSNRDAQNFVRLGVLVFDDAQADESRLPITYKIETSAENYQIGYALADSPDARDVVFVKRVIKALIAANVLKPDKSGNNPVRWVRLPRGSNTKNGGSFPTVLREWHPERRYTITQVLEAYGVSLDAVAETAKPKPKVERVHDLASQIQTLVNGGNGVHDAQVSIGMKLIQGGTKPHIALEMLDALVVDDNSERMIARRMDNERIIQSAVDKVAAETAKTVVAFTTVSALDFLRRPRPNWLIKKFLPDRGIAIVYGPRSSGKSFLVLDMAASIVQGKPWRERKTRKTRVAYVAAEGAYGFRNRLDALHQNGADLSNVVIIPAAPNITRALDVEYLIEAIRASGGAGLVILDTLAQVTAGADENSAQMQLAISAAQQMGNELDAVVIIVAHSGKDAAKGVRGWSGIEGAADFILEVIRESGRRSATVRKLKDDVDGLTFYFDLQQVVIGRDEDDDAITSCLVSHSAESETPPQKTTSKNPMIRGALKRIVFQSFKDLIGSAVIDEVKIDAVVESARSSATDRDGKPRRSRDILYAVDALIGDGLLCRSGDGLRYP